MYGDPCSPGSGGINLRFQATWNLESPKRESMEPGTKLCTERLQVFLIDCIERVRGVGIHIQDGQQVVLGRDDRNDDLGLRGRRARDVVLAGVDVRYELSCSRSSRGAAHAAGKRNVETAMRALVRADHQLFGTDDSVEAGPVEVVERVVQLAGDGRHRSRPVDAVVEEAVDMLADFLVPGVSFSIRGVDGERRSHGSDYVVLDPRGGAGRPMYNIIEDIDRGSITQYRS